MGTPGVPLNIDKDRILEAIKRRKGVITHICKELDITHETCLKHIRKDPDLVKALSDARHEMDDLMCDAAESTLLRAVTQSDDLGNALKGSMYILNNKGRGRGYAPPTETVTDELMKQAALHADRVIENLSKLKKNSAKSEEISDHTEKKD